VRDRLRTDRVASTLSGGMDSTLCEPNLGGGKSTRIRKLQFQFGLAPARPAERHWAWLCATIWACLPFAFVGTLYLDHQMTRGGVPNGSSN
jgi:hypothetical protein